MMPSSGVSGLALAVVLLHPAGVFYVQKAIDISIVFLKKKRS